MTKKYLGEFPVLIKDSPYKDWQPKDWALHFIEAYGQIDGAHHKTWVLDQVARILHGTPIEITLAKWEDEDNSTYEEEYRFVTSEPSQEYLTWRHIMLGEIDEDGDYEYDYDEGIAP